MSLFDPDDFEPADPGCDWWPIVPILIAAVILIALWAL